MGKMAHIAYLISIDDRDALIEELDKTDIAKATGQSVEEIADGFIEAYGCIEKNQNDSAYNKLHDIQEEMIHTHKMHEHG